MILAIVLSVAFVGLLITRAGGAKVRKNKYKFK